MTYQEFVLLYVSLVSGLACTYLLDGLGSIIKRWREIKIDVAFLIAFLVLFLSIIDFWFHSFDMNYALAKGHILIFLIFMVPPAMLFLGTLVLFPSPEHECDDYVDFFRKKLRTLVAFYGLFIMSFLLQTYISDFMTNIFIIPLAIYLGFCICLYIVNSVKAYKIMATIGIIANTMRWVIEGIV